MYGEDAGNNFSLTVQELPGPWANKQLLHWGGKNKALMSPTASSVVAGCEGA